MPREILISGVGIGGGSWLAMVERLKAELHRESVPDEDTIKRAIITRMEFWRWHRFWFNEGSTTILTTPSVAEYGRESSSGSGDGFPRDLLAIDDLYVSQVPIVNPEDPPGRLLPMEKARADSLRLLIGRGVTQFRPRVYSWQGDDLLIYPIPDGRYQIVFDYLRDLDVPSYRFVGGAWEYLDENGSEITDDFTNVWLAVAEELIRNGVKADLYANVLFGQDKAAAARQQEEMAFRNLQRATKKRMLIDRIRPGNIEHDILGDLTEF